MAASESDRAFFWGGAIIVALIFGIGFWIRVSPVVGVTSGLAAGAAWLLLGTVGRRRRRRNRRG
ncbi:hypothetical protein [Phytoactinopolyspora halotolerans]|uniref:DUF2530 domain-containing protein n=1 Tax=Phytoactinopolyspora halotolerans TaxID=1981512 RepID=A0A6L9SEN9_9ACTN|nr:hypothetical protein [Phytoactinopolyspora halotolerans]NEE02951.1 hypothetical protein [Phytoactinopolyspora halotolerans]